LGRIRRMDNTPKDLSKKTDAELKAMLRELTIQIDIIGKEQTRRTGSESRAARDAEANEGGPSTPETE
jgi:hypothetical protein